MAETFIINQLVIKSKRMTKVERLQQEKEMIIQLVAILDYQYFKDHYQLIAVDLYKQK